MMLEIVSTEPTATNEEPPPPSYFDIFGEPKSRIDTVKYVLCQPIWPIALLGIVQLTIGLSRKEKCPIDSRITLWLIVNGAGLIALTVIELWHWKKGATGITSFFYHYKVFILYHYIQLFLVIWLGLGTFWFYSVFESVQYSRLKPRFYCDEMVFLIAFSSISGTWLSLGLGILCYCSYINLF